MDTQILVACATKYGATAEIVRKIGEVLSEAGLQAEVLPVNEVGDLTPYLAVVLGSAVYMGKWRDEAAKFLEDNEGALAERPVWLFSSGALGEGDPVELMQGWRFPEAQQEVAERIQPRDIAFFHGVLDTKRLSMPERLMAKGIKTPTGDFRDWEAITSWAKVIADTLKREAA